MKSILSEYNHSSSLFEREGRERALTIFTEGDPAKRSKYFNFFTKLLLGTGILLSTVNPLGSKQDVINESKDSKIEEYKLYIVNGKLSKIYEKIECLHGLVGCNLDNIESKPEKCSELKKVLIDKCNNAMIHELDFIHDNFHINWAGNHGVPLDHQVYRNVLKIAESVSDLFKEWSLVLRTNGSISIMSNDDRASIDIAREHISFYVITKEREKLFQRHIKIDFKKDLTVIKKIINLWEITK